jgi:ABC-type sugar transport system substrate-binding protein
MTTKQTAGRSIVLLLVTILAAGSSGSAAMQTAATGRLMREKLGHAQRVLEALTTSDYALLERESTALSQATKQLGWMVLKTPQYSRQSDAFLRASEDLLAAAKAHDLDLAAMHYMSLTMSCYQCHRYVKNQRIATAR